MTRPFSLFLRLTAYGLTGVCVYLSPPVAAVAVPFAMGILWRDRDTWMARARKAEREVCDRRQAESEAERTREGYLRRRRGDRQLENNSLWTMLASDRRGANFTYGQDAGRN